MAILDGDIDKALKHVNAYYPNVLRDNEHIYFRLCCRKFIEKIRECSELQHMVQSSSDRRTRSTDGRSQSDDEADEDEYENELMELDEQAHAASLGWESMEIARVKHSLMLQETINYGQLLQSQFGHEGKKKALEDTFSLLAYEDPKTSVVAHLLDPSERVSVAEELNSAILGR